MIDTILTQLSTEFNIPIQEVELRLIRQLSKIRGNPLESEGGAPWNGLYKKLL